MGDQIQLLIELAEQPNLPAETHAQILRRLADRYAEEAQYLQLVGSNDAVGLARAARNDANAMNYLAKAEQLYSSLLGQEPCYVEQDEVTFMLACVFEAEGRPDSARGEFSILLMRWPESEWASDARLHLHGLGTTDTTTLGK